MVALTRPQRLIVPMPTAAAAGAGGLIFLSFLLVPTGLLEAVVGRSGIAAILAAAEPPLGFTARIALGLVLGGLGAAFACVAAYLIAPERTIALDDLVARWKHRVPKDAPPRPPLFANQELGTPFLSVKAASEPPAQTIAFAKPEPAPVAAPVEQDVPLDLDQPLAAFDPSAILAVPMTPAEPVAPLARPQLIDPGDRFETFELTPVQRPAPPSLRVSPPAAPSMPEAAAEPAVVAPQTETTIHALLARLEQGIAARSSADLTRPAPTPTPTPAQAPTRGSLEHTLGDLRRLATGAA